MMKLTDILREILVDADYDNDAGQPFWGNVGAGVLPIAKKTQRLLISLRSSLVNEPNTWGVVGGKLDDVDGSSVKIAASREFKEETGYRGNIQLHPAYVFKTTGFEYHNFIGLIDDEFTPRLDWETERFEWLTFDEVMNLSPKHFGLEKLLADKKSMDIIQSILGGYVK